MTVPLNPKRARMLNRDTGTLDTCFTEDGRLKLLPGRHRMENLRPPVGRTRSSRRRSRSRRAGRTHGHLSVKVLRFFPVNISSGGEGGEGFDWVGE